MATPIFETTGDTNGTKKLTRSFDIGPTPVSFKATLSDLSYGPLASDFLGIVKIPILTALQSVSDRHGQQWKYRR